MPARRNALVLLFASACTEARVSAPDATLPDASIADASVLPDRAPPDSSLPDALVPYVPEAFAPTAATRAYCAGHDDSAIESRITSWLAMLSPVEKVQLLHGAGISATDGGWRVAGNARLGIPGLRMLDGARGVSDMIHIPATAFPVGMMRGATWDIALEQRVGMAIAEEIRSVGSDMVLAPTMNLLRHPRWGRAQETYSEDTQHMGSMAVAFIQGIQSRGVLANAKHYAANSIENTRHSVDVHMDERTLREIYLPHFRHAVIDANVASVMSAYNHVNGQWCDQNTHLLTDILRNEWGFSGFVESDWLLGTHGDAESLHAGLDIEMPLGPHYSVLPARLASGAITERDLDASVRRVLRAQLCFDLDTRVRSDDPSARLTTAHLALAREVAQRGIVLLRNESVHGAPALPFGADVHRIVVLGRNATVENIGDHGSSNVLPGDVVTALEGLAAHASASLTVTHLAGTTLDATAMDTVRAADAVVVVTGNQAGDEGEGEVGAGDRASLDLRASEIALVQAAGALNGRVVVVLEAGAAITVSDWQTSAAAVLFAFYPGAQGGNSLADVLFGTVAPSGRLPFSIPVREADLPPFDNTSAMVTYGYLHGYRYLAANGTAPAYPFGAGLSYTTFSYGPLTVSRETLHAGESVDATVTVHNDGAVRAIETVQLYASASSATVMRAPRDLRAFAQVDLAPGESRAVTLTMRADDLAYWDAGASRMVLEPVAYTLTAAHDAVSTGPTATVNGQ